MLKCQIRKAEIARIEYLEIKDDLKKNFEKANTLTQRLLLFAHVILKVNLVKTGMFEDTGIQNVHHGIIRVKRSDLMNSIIFSICTAWPFIDNHFESSPSALKPLFKRFPKLARLYGIPTEGVSSKPKKTVIVDGTDWKTVKPTG